MRIAKAHKEMQFHNDFDQIVLNDDLVTAQNDAYQKIIQFIKAD
jgi:guanylate kinase